MPIPRARSLTRRETSSCCSCNGSAIDSLQRRRSARLRERSRLGARAWFRSNSGTMLNAVAGCDRACRWRYALYFEIDSPGRTIGGSRAAVPIARTGFLNRARRSGIPTARRSTLGRCVPDRFRGPLGASFRPRSRPSLRPLDGRRGDGGVHESFRGRGSGIPTFVLRDSCRCHGRLVFALDSASRFRSDSVELSFDLLRSPSLREGGMPPRREPAAGAYRARRELRG